MADEPALPDGGEDPNTPPVEGEAVTDPNTNDEAPADDPIATLASEMGWVPQDQFRGDPAEWKPAADFIKTGHEIQRTVSRELRSVREELGRVTRTSGQLMADAIAERDAHWKRVQDKAVEDGDTATAERAFNERAKLKETTAEPASQPPETSDFVERHKTWFGKDPLATMRAKEIADRLAKDGYPAAEQLVQVERAIRKEFPEHFAPPAKRPAAVDTATSRSANRSSVKRGYNDMPPESRKMADDYLKRHGIPLEKFAESFWADPANHERKVG